MFVYNGHGETIRLENPMMMPTFVELNPREYIIMNSTPTPTRGSAWLQDVLWKNVLSSKNKYDFVKNIEDNINKNPIKTGRRDLFGYYGSSTIKTICPNLMLDSGFEYVGGISERFGLFESPIRINNDNFESIRRSVPRHISDLILIKSVPRMGDGSQLNLIDNEHITFRGNTSYLHNIILYLRSITKDGFVLFCNVCRTIYDEYRYDEISLSIAQPLAELVKILEPVRLSAAAPLFFPKPEISPPPPIRVLSSDTPLFVPRSGTDPTGKIAGGFRSKYEKYLKKLMNA